MKRKILQITTVSLVLITALVSCKKEPVDGLVIDQSSLYLGVGKTVTLTVTFIPANATNKKVSWESSDPNIVTVNNGTITGVAKGKATISVISQDNGRRTQCAVMVIQPVEPKMVWVEGGTFTMGCTEEQGEDCYEDEKPSHQVTVSGFYIGKYEVTQKEWVATMGANPSSYKGELLPVDNISWNDIQEYIFKLKAATGNNYRLPTEAEWEYAARGGNKSQHNKYSGSNNYEEVAWHLGNGDSHPHSVGKKKPNELGIYDMSGNVFEFCSDWYGEYTDDILTNPIGPTEGKYRILRGGGWNNHPIFTRISCRSTWTPQHSCGVGGFRLVMPAE